LAPGTAVRIERVSGTRALAAALPAWTREPQNVILHADLDSAPATWVIDWMSALHRSRHPVTWNGALAPLAISAAPEADPRGAVRIVVAAPDRARVTVSDDAGV